MVTPRAVGTYRFQWTVSHAPSASGAFLVFQDPINYRVRKIFVLFGEKHVKQRQVLLHT